MRVRKDTAWELQRTQGKVRDKARGCSPSHVLPPPLPPPRRGELGRLLPHNHSMDFTLEEIKCLAAKGSTAPLVGPNLLRNITHRAQICCSSGDRHCWTVSKLDCFSCVHDKVNGRRRTRL